MTEEKFFKCISENFRILLLQLLFMQKYNNPMKIYFIPKRTAKSVFLK